VEALRDEPSEILKNLEQRNKKRSYNRRICLDASTLLMETTVSLMPWIHGTVPPYRKNFANGLMPLQKLNDSELLLRSPFVLWFINSLYKIRHKKGKDMFDQLLSYSNHLGLFSEDIDFKTRSVCSPVISTKLIHTRLDRNRY
jgi:hypothetical protein